MNLSRSIGDSEYKVDKKLKPQEQILSKIPDVKIENWSKDINFIVFACDGIWDCKNKPRSL